MLSGVMTQEAMIPFQQILTILQSIGNTSSYINHPIIAYQMAGHSLNSDSARLYSTNSVIPAIQCQIS